MEPDAVDTVRFLLAIVIVGCLALLTIVFPRMDAEDGPPVTQFRDLDREHRLGGHYQSPHPHCPKCRKGDV